MPAVISVVEKINEPRYPSFKGIMAAKSKPIQTLTHGRPGHRRRRGRPGERARRRCCPSRSHRRAQAGQVVKDEGNGGAQIADFLASKKLI